MVKFEEAVIAVVGLGYVGLPLAVEFARQRRVVGFDTSKRRIEDLRSGHDDTREVSAENLASASMLEFTGDAQMLQGCNVFIVTVPTPVDSAKRPDLEPLRKASELVGTALRKGGVVIYESTVYPGCTEEFCIPILEKASGLRCNETFFVGYSPERVNPGDPSHRLTAIRKVTSGSTPDAARFVDELYRRIIAAGTYLAPSIKVAEAAKVIENTQRDLNIALMNELSLIFGRLGIDTQDVLDAASTKWNFLSFRPGLVGGHCIGVDPYYLTHKAQEIGYHPEIILAGRRINDGMGSHVAEQVVKLMLRRGLPVSGGRILVMGISFKENCPDLRNSRVIDVVSGLENYSAKVDVWDPWVDPEDCAKEFGFASSADAPTRNDYNAVVIAVAHDHFRKLGIDRIREFAKSDAIVYDVKGIYPREKVDGRL
jgi:UDP-N-acetyl-D-galactosamine dehydrogenase